MSWAYLYKAALLCEECGERIIKGHSEWVPVKGLTPSFVEAFRLRPGLAPEYRLVNGVICEGVKHAPLQCPGDLTDERTFDSDDYPKGPYPDGGGESECAACCDKCHCSLDNPVIGGAR